MKLKFIKFLHKFSLLQYLYITYKSNLNGVNFKIPIIKGIGYSNLFMSERWMIDLLKIIYKIKKGNFVDVGVNLGQSLLKFKSLQLNHSYIGFEPNPSCLFYLENLIEANNLDKTEIYPVGISTKTQIAHLNFFSNSYTDSSASILEQFRPKEKIKKKSNIALFCISDLQINLEPVSVIKIDVEGAELEVLISFINIIKKNNPFILMEILPVYDNSNTYRLERQNAILLILKENNYSIYRILKENDILKGFQHIDSIEIHSNLNYCEYLMINNNDAESFEKYVSKLNKYFLQKNV